MKPATDLTGQRFGRLVVGECIAKKNGRHTCMCQCDCGSTKEMKPCDLLSGKTVSCGCLRSERLKDGLHATHGQYATPANKSWSQMIQRCTNPSDPVYQKYGAAGITVCDRWMVFENFLADMGERPSGTTLDRWPNQKGNYEPGNCRWATPLEQSNNLSNNFRVEYKGVTYTIRELSEVAGVPYVYLRNRVYRKRADPAMVVDQYEAALRKQAA